MYSKSSEIQHTEKQPAHSALQHLLVLQAIFSISKLSITALDFADDVCLLAEMLSVLENDTVMGNAVIPR